MCFQRMASSLKPYLCNNGPLILDGGLATELEAQGAVIQVRMHSEETSPGNMDLFEVISVKMESLDQPLKAKSSFCVKHPG